jgi:hypothetical protein
MMQQVREHFQEKTQIQLETNSIKINTCEWYISKNSPLETKLIREVKNNDDIKATDWFRRWRWRSWVRN